jgi:CubicO group peptidase (beta-lactamase class C family)
VDMIKIIQGLLAGVLLGTLAGCEYIDDIPVGARYIAKNICSGLFVSGYDEDLLVNDYVTSVVPQLKSIWSINIDVQVKQVSVSDKFFKQRHQALSVYREGLGCVNQRDETVEALRNQVDFPLQGKVLLADRAWPYGSAGVDSSAVNVNALSDLSVLLDKEFINPDGKVKHTTGVVIVKDGKLIMERYAGGLTSHAAVKGFSMSKTLVNALGGVLYDKGVLELDAPLAFDEWEGTDKTSITFSHLAHMSSGLKYTERAIGNDNDQGLLLYGTQQPFDFMTGKSLIATPGEQYNYSSGDNLLAARELQNLMGGMANSYRIIRDDLFHKIDVTSALIEHSGDGYMLAPESLMLSVRDWARFGWLYSNRGRWGEDQVLSEEWIDYSLTPAEANESYGAFLWLNTGQWFFEDLPKDTIAFVGALERYVIIIPSLGIVVVRVGFSHDRDTVDINAFVKSIADVLSGVVPLEAE